MIPPETGITFRDLIAPLTPERFFADYYGKRFLHVPGGAGKFRGLFGWDSFNRLINMTTLWTPRTMKMAKDGANLPPETFCQPGTPREGGRDLVPDWPKVGDLLRGGATVVLDIMEMLDSGSAAIAAALQMATASRVTCNAYCSRRQRPAFNSHFDTMEVFAVHVEGEKTWRLYEGRFDAPIEATGYRYSSFDQAYHDHAKGAVAAEITLTPGDLLYIPRGLYHDALATTEACLHLSFGTTRPTGLDFLRTVLRAATAEPLFRRDMPGIDAPEAYRDHVRKLAARLNAMLEDPAVTNSLLEEQRRRLFDMIPGFALPDPEFASYYRVQARGVKLARRGKDWQLAAGDRRETLGAASARVAEWVLGRDLITRSEAEAALPGVSETDIRNAVSTLRGMGILLPA